MKLQKSLSFSTKPNELGPNFLNPFAQLGNVNTSWWHACVNELCEEHVHIFGGFENFKV